MFFIETKKEILFSFIDKKKWKKKKGESEIKFGECSFAKPCMPL